MRAKSECNPKMSQMRINFRLEARKILKRDALKILNCQVVKKDISADACQEVFTSLYGLVRRLGIGTPRVG